eukprot:246253_1
MSSITTINNLLTTFDEKESKEVIPDKIETKIMYAHDVGKHIHIEMPSKTNPSGTFDGMKPCHKMTTVRNGRNVGITYGQHGFQLVSQTTKLTTKDFYCNDNEIIQKIYYKELENRVREITGAEYVKCMHHIVRCAGTPPKYAKIKAQKPAHAAHTDYSSGSAFKTFKAEKPKDPKYLKGRFAVINVWRNISDTNVIKNDHLAMCDGRSVDAPDDFLPYHYIADGYKSESYYLNGARVFKYKWYYFPEMAKNEMLIFKQYDSDYNVKARYAFHTAINDPTAPKKNCPSRESIETRLIAFFPQHTPNTIPEIEEVDIKEAIPDSVKSLFNAIESSHMWPQQHYDNMCKIIGEKDIEEVIKSLVNGSAKGGYHGMSDYNKDQINEVTELIIKRKDEFKKICCEQFIPRDESKSNIDVVGNAVKGIF